MKKFFLSFLCIGMFFLASCSAYKNVDVTVPGNALSACMSSNIAGEDFDFDEEFEQLKIDFTVTGNVDYSKSLYLSFAQLDGYEFTVPEVDVGSTLNLVLEVYGIRSEATTSSSQEILLLKGSVENYKVSRGNNTVELEISYQLGFVDGDVSVLKFNVVSATNKPGEYDSLEKTVFYLRKSGKLSLSVDSSMEVLSEEDVTYSWKFGETVIGTEKDLVINVNTFEAPGFYVDPKTEFYINCYIDYNKGAVKQSINVLVQPYSVDYCEPEEDDDDDVVWV